MRRCLWPGGLLRTGRRSVTPYIRLSAFSYPKLSHSQARPTETEESIAAEENALILSYNSLPPPPLYAYKGRNVYAWAPHVAKCLRTAKQGKAALEQLERPTSLLDYTEALDGGHGLKGILHNARMGPGLQLLNLLGFQQKQWPYVYNILSTLIDTYELLIPHMTPRRMAPSISWLDTGMSLHTLTSKNRDDLIVKRELIPTCPPSETTSLSKMTGQRPAVRDFADTFLAETLASLGSLILEAADRPAAEAEAAMPYVYRSLARLHHLDLISDRVYQCPDIKLNQLSMRPPGMHLLSSHIMSVLSDAAWLEHESALASAATEAGEDPPFVPFKVGVRELGPEIWFELVLWCCVEHGFNKQGAWLVDQMSKRKGRLSWNIESWEPFSDALDVVQQTNISTEKSWRRPGQENPIATFKGTKKPPFNGLGQRTISSEVVSSLRTGLANDAYNGIGFHGSSPSDLLKFSAPLTALLDPPGPEDELRPTNKVATENIVRIIESGCLLPREDPTSFEKVLRSTQSLVPPWENSAVPSAEDLDSMTRGQLYDETAALSGLVEYNVKGYSYQGQASTAFIQYAWLQNIVDASKAHHIKAFFEHLSQSPSSDVPFFDSQRLDMTQLTQSSLPQVSPSTLADLLDLATATRADAFGNWLLFNDDVDGPSIPPASYGGQLLAPSILRFAAATQNKELSQSVVKSLEMPLGVNALKAMANLHISFGDWERSILAFKYLRDYRLRSWGFSNIMALGAKIVRLEDALKRSRSSNAPTEVQDRLKQSLSCATDLLNRFFDGEFNTPRSRNQRVTDFQERVLERVRSIFLSVPGQLADVASRKSTRKFQSRDKLQYIPVVSFHTLLSAIVQVRSFEFSKNFLFKWCRAPGTPESWRQKEGGVTRLQAFAERDWEQNDPSYNPKWHQHTMEKAVIPNLNTYRILSRVALQEYSVEQGLDDKTGPTAEQTPETSPSSSPPIESSTSSTSRRDGYKLGVPKRILEHQTQKGGLPPSSPAEANLDLCVRLFLRAGMPEEQIEFELPGHLRRLRYRGVLTPVKAKRYRDRFKQIQDGPWMDAHIKEMHSKQSDF
ncbi:hypothetical protein N7456_009849 [Penicillium angulare]|uniref:Uncharacterized protein n=1 Tax=Penicillium angulare TaxID=116970 RepID=A0A9W9K5L0_9EURO|nr:hypothetical protein N7456_009849 [Penicillium angulare]